MREEGEGCRVSLWGHDSRSSKLLALSRHSYARRGNTRIPYYWNVPLVLGYESILHCHGVSDKVLYSRNPKKYSIPYRIFFWSHKGVCGLSDFSNYDLLLSEMPQMPDSQTLSNIIYPIEYTYDYTQVPAGYPTFSIAYLIYSTSHVAEGIQPLDIILI